MRVAGLGFVQFCQWLYGGDVQYRRSLALALSFLLGDRNALDLVSFSGHYPHFFDHCFRLNLLILRAFSYNLLS